MKLFKISLLSFAISSLCVFSAEASAQNGGNCPNRLKVCLIVDGDIGQGFWLVRQETVRNWGLRTGHKLRVRLERSSHTEYTIAPDGVNANALIKRKKDRFAYVLVPGAYAPYLLLPSCTSENGSAIATIPKKPTNVRVGRNRGRVQCN